jgi:hypothetical protein
MLLLPVLEKEENKNGGTDKLLPLWRKKEKHQWRGRSVVERMVVQLAVTVVVAAEGTVEKEKGERERERERERRQKKKKNRGGGWFFSDFGPDFLLLRPSNPPLWSGATSVYVPMSR